MVSPIARAVVEQRPPRPGSSRPAGDFPGSSSATFTTLRRRRRSSRSTRTACRGRTSRAADSGARPLGGDRPVRVGRDASLRRTEPVDAHEQVFLVGETVFPRRDRRLVRSTRWRALRRSRARSAGAGTSRTSTAPSFSYCQMSDDHQSLVPGGPWKSGVTLGLVFLWSRLPPTSTPSGRLRHVKAFAHRARRPAGRRRNRPRILQRGTARSGAEQHQGGSDEPRTKGRKNHGFYRSPQPMRMAVWNIGMPL